MPVVYVSKDGPPNNQFMIFKLENGKWYLLTITGHWERATGNPARQNKLERYGHIND